MPTKTSVGSGLWSAAGTWDAGVPVNNDTVVIASGHTVEFDVDTSTFANGIAGITINGTLKLTRNAGTYYLKLGNYVISGQGLVDAGTAISPIPSTTKHSIIGGNGFCFIGNSGSGLSFSCFAAEPVIKFVRLTETAPIGTTVLKVDQSVIGDLWAVGDHIIVADFLKAPATAQDYETRFIASGGISSGTITLTVGLSAQKEVGAYIILVSRNVKVYGGASLFQNFTMADKRIVIGGGNFGSVTTGNSAIFYKCFGIIATGGVFNAAYSLTSYTDRSSFKNCVFTGFSNYCFINDSALTADNCVIVGLRSCFSFPCGVVISNSLFASISNVIVSAPDLTFLNCLFTGNKWVVYIGQLGKFISCTFYQNQLDCYGGMVKAYNTSFETYDVVLDPSLAVYAPLYGPLTYNESIDDGGVPGAYCAWTTGAVSIFQSLVIPDGFTKAMKTTFRDGRYPGYWQREVVVGSGASLNIKMHLRKDVSMSYLPNIVIFDKRGIDAILGGVPLNTFTMTNSIDTWESDVYTYTNTGAEDVTLVIRVQGMNATGNMYSALLVEQINVDLTSAIALINGVKAKTDQLVFTVANQVDANSLTGGTSAADVRIEMDANSTKLAAILDDTGTTLDGIVDAIKAKTDNLPATPADEVLLEAAISAIPAGISVADILTAVADGTLTVQDSIKLMNAALAGKLDGGGTGTLKFRNPDDTLDRITATVDLANGDRDAQTYDLS